MNAQAVPGELNKRVLDADSKQFVCDVYPPGKASRACLLKPFDGKLGKAQGCSSVGGELILLALLLSRRRR